MEMLTEEEKAKEEKEKEDFINWEVKKELGLGRISRTKKETKQYLDLVEMLRRQHNKEIAEQYKEKKEHKDLLSDT